MKIARLRHPVILQKYFETQDSTVGTVKKWQAIQSVFAEIQQVKGYVTFNSQQIEQAITHHITIRFQPFITTENWIQFNTRRFRIRSVENLLEANRFLLLKCEEVFIATESFAVGQGSVGDSLNQEITLSPYLLMNYYTFILMSGEQFNLMG